MHEADEVQLVASQPGQCFSQEGADVVLVHVAQGSAQVAVVALTHASSCLQQAMGCQHASP